MSPFPAAFWGLALLTLLISGAARLKSRLLHDDLTLTFFNVGQGDSSLVALPGGARWLVDGGGAFLEKGIGRKHLFGELTSQAVLTVDTMLLSHPDLDHGEGFLPLLADLKINQLLLPASFLSEKPPKLLLTQLLARAGVRRTPVRGVAIPERFEFPNGFGELVPVPGKSANDRALVLRLVMGECSAIYAGDLEIAGEAWLAKHAQDHHWPEATVLKVAHHGSQTSSHPPLLNALRPRLAIVSSGLANRYGHPHPFALERLRQWKSELLRTDFHGAVTISLTENHWHCTSETGPCGSGACSTQAGRGSTPRPEASAGPRTSY